MTKIFKNKNFTKRNYDCTNIVYQVTASEPRDYNGEPSENWVEEDTTVEAIVEAGMMKLGGFGDHTFFGYM